MSAGSQSYLDVKEKALRVRALYDRRGLRLHPTCALSVLLQGAIDLSENWLLGSGNSISYQSLFQAADTARISEAILTLEASDNPDPYLRKLRSGTIDSLTRGGSPAKDTLWELELYLTARNRGLAATLEEPDVALDLDGTKIGVACKRIYSPDNVEKVLSDAVHQVERHFDTGVVAINIDELIPNGHVAQVPRYEELGQLIQQRNQQFMADAEPYLRRYLADERVICALVSTGCLAHLLEGGQQVNWSRHSVVWAMPGIKPDKGRLVSAFRHRLLN